jgi:predicted peroxiredoxin
MTAATDSASSPARLVILLNGVGRAASQSALIPLRYAATAAAMDVAVEMHAVSSSVALFRRGAAEPELLTRIRQAVELGVEIFVCPLALVEQEMTIDDLIDEVAGVRGAASLLVAGLAPGARFMVF